MSGRSFRIGMVLASTLLLAPTLRAGEAAAPKLTDATYKKWLDFVRPSAQEDLWKKIGWRTSLSKAIGEAKELNRPILLWTMNGHPCGTT